MENIKKLWQMFFTSNDSGYYVMNKEFYEQFEPLLSEYDQKLIQQYLNYRDKLRAKLYVLFSPKFGTAIPSLREYIIYYPHILFNKL